jgi:ketosteroid isomerase-like protein
MSEVEAAARVRDFWSRVQARDWPSARALLHDGLTATWWTSGERFGNADAFVAVQARYPEGWTIRLVECVPVSDGRILSLVRVDHPPQAFFATSLFSVEDGRIRAIDEYWATVEPPPAWRTPEAFPGLVRFDPRDDPRARLP